MQIKFTKMHGLGNDFMVVDGVTQKVFFNHDLIKRLGDRHFGVGFDQLLLVEPPYNPDLDFHYRIFNQDGSEVQMCGNGARCFARFVYDHGLCNKREIHVSTMAGELTLKIEDDGEVVVNMGQPILDPSKIPTTFTQEAPYYEVPIAPGKAIWQDKEIQSVKVGAVSMGNPHTIIDVADVANCELPVLGPILECHPCYPEKVNVEFRQIISRSEIKVRVFERGVGETLACGTGACASVVSGIVQGLLDHKVKVHLPGGDLTITWEGPHKPVMMKGPATNVFEGIINI